MLSTTSFFIHYILFPADKRLMNFHVEWCVTCPLLPDCIITQSINLDVMQVDIGWHDRWIWNGRWWAADCSSSASPYLFGEKLLILSVLFVYFNAKKKRCVVVYVVGPCVIWGVSIDFPFYFSLIALCIKLPYL